MYSIQHYVIKCPSDLRKGRWFFTGTPVSSTNKTDHHDISELLLSGVKHQNHNRFRLLDEFNVDIMVFFNNFFFSSGVTGFY
jgi:hypothetical protein